MKNGDEYSVGDDQVQKQLEKILSSERFGNARLLSMFLKFIVEETLAGHINAIKEYTIATNVLGRPADFNPQMDAVVRIHAGRLRRLLADYYRTDGAGDDVLIEIPKGSYVPVFRKKKEGEIPGEINHQNTSPPLIKNNDHKGGRYRKITLIVFPFQNPGTDTSMAHFVESTGEQLSVDLAKFRHLDVISYYSISKAAIEIKHIGDIHKQYDVDYVLTGSVRFSNKTVQINMQLVNAHDGTIAWTHSFVQPHDSHNLFTIQDAIIEQTVNKIADIDGVIARNIINGPLTGRKDELGIYHAIYLYFCFRSKYDHQSYREALDSLQQAVVADPRNALIWSILANLYLGNFIFQLEPRENDLDKVRDYAERALWLDPYSQYGYEALAWVYLVSGKKNDCMEAIERCLDLNKRALTVVGRMGFLLICLGKYEQGFRLLLRGMHLNFVTAWYVVVGFSLYYYNSGDYKESAYWIDKLVVPEIPLTSLIREAANNKKNDPEISMVKERPASTHQSHPVLDQYIRDEQLKERLLEGLAES